MVHHKPILILMGPTASGKSAMGLRIAEQAGGAILNADAMQCYADLRVLTARPSETEMQGVPHHLYGMWGARTQGNAARWLEAATQAIRRVHAAGQVPILLGGTGMYLKVLTEGLSNVPPISQEVKEEVSKLSCRLYDGIRNSQTPSCDGVTALYKALQEHDPRMAAQLQPGDMQRVARALEVVLQTGRSLADWQAEQQPGPFMPEQCRWAYIDIPRDIVYARINKRFENMVQHGAVDEVAALKAHFSPEEIAEQRFPILKAHGVPELMAYLDGEMSLQRAIELGQRNTRRYAKRQMTWLRGQVVGAVALSWKNAETAMSLLKKNL